MPVENMNYGGPDRRRHRVYVTRNSEYHTRDGVCIAVRDRRTGEFQTRHAAIGKKVSAGIRFSREGGISGVSEPGNPHVGDQLCLSSGSPDHEDELITSTLNAIERPPKEIVVAYPIAS